MDSVSYKTVSANKATVKKEWVIVDVEGEILGRVSSKIAMVLRGKHKPSYTPHVDCGDNVIVLNADKVVLTGLKYTEKEYITYSGYPGGQRIKSPKELFKKHPERVVEEAIRGMLPKNRLGRELFRNLHVYTGVEHPHAAQNPVNLDINTIK